MQPGHPQVGKHPGRKTGTMPGQQHEHGHHIGLVSAPKLVKHKIGSHHAERTHTGTKNVGAEGHRNKGSQVGGGEAMRPNLSMQRRVKGKHMTGSMIGKVVP